MPPTHPEMRFVSPRGGVVGSCILDLLSGRVVGNSQFLIPNS
jgi:hypothetical protein